MPLRHRHGYAAGFHRGLPVSDLKPTQEFLARNERRVRTAIQPISTGFELAGNLRGVMTLVPLVHLPVSLAGPGPSDSFWPAPSLSGLLAILPGVSRIGLPPASLRCCDSTAAEVFHLRSVTWRLVALEITFPEAGNRTILGLNRTFADVDHVPDLSPGHGRP